MELDVIEWWNTSDARSMFCQQAGSRCGYSAGLDKEGVQWDQRLVGVAAWDGAALNIPEGARHIRPQHYLGRIPAWHLSGALLYLLGLESIECKAFASTTTLIGKNKMHCLGRLISLFSQAVYHDICKLAIAKRK